MHDQSVGSVSAPEPNQRDHAMHWLLTAIFAGRFSPDDQFSLDLVAEELELPRSPVDEAAFHVERFGFVRLSANRKTTVVSVWDVKDIHNRLEVLATMAAVYCDYRPAIHRSYPWRERHYQSGFRTATEDIHELFRLCAIAINNVSNPVVKNIMQELLIPLRSFFTRGIPERHGLDLAPGQQRRIALLEVLYQDLRIDSTQNPLDSLVLALDQLASELHPTGHKQKHPQPKTARNA